MSSKIEASQLEKTWIHSHEEDAGGRKTYRSEDFEFPPARGRSSFTLLPDGVAVVGSPGPDDRPRSAGGSWSLEDNLLTIHAPGISGAFEVVTADDSILVVRSVGKE